MGFGRKGTYGRGLLPGLNGFFGDAPPAIVRDDCGDNCIGVVHRLVAPEYPLPIGGFPHDDPGLDQPLARIFVDIGEFHMVSKNGGVSNPGLADVCHDAVHIIFCVSCMGTFPSDEISGGG